MTPRVVIAGGGVAGLEALLALRAIAGDALDVTLVAPVPDFVYRPLATGDPFVVTHVERRPLAEIARDQDAELVTGSLAAVDTGARTANLSDGDELPYDHLLIAVGARQHPPLEHVLTFGGPADVEAFHGLVQDIEGGYVKRLAFVVPSTVVWPFPAYELALMTAERAHSMWVDDAELALVTAEHRPLEVFGAKASDAVEALLDEAGVRLFCSSEAVREGSELRIEPSGVTLNPERVIACPLLTGPAIDGLPSSPQGFVPIDGHARVPGAAQVYAAGDAVEFPIKQGGIASQQADAAAEAIAHDAGVAGEPHEFRPVLRGMLLTGGRPRFMRSDVPAGEHSELSERPLWWPPDKIAGRYLAPYLGAPHVAGVSGESSEMLPVEHPLDSAEVPEAYRRFGHFTGE